ncbi:Hypothetical protein PHPALM_1691, partial [Phytophthora palmivora]
MKKQTSDSGASDQMAMMTRLMELTNMAEATSYKTQVNGIYLAQQMQQQFKMQTTADWRNHLILPLVRQNNAIGVQCQTDGAHERNGLRTVLAMRQRLANAHVAIEQVSGAKLVGQPATDLSAQAACAISCASMTRLCPLSTMTFGRHATAKRRTRGAGTDADFPDFTVSPEVHRDCKDLATKLLAHTVHEFERYAYDESSVSHRRWKAKSTRNDITLYRERDGGSMGLVLADSLHRLVEKQEIFSPTAATLIPPTLLLIGARQGYVENAMSTLVTLTQDELALVVKFLHGDVADCAVLHTMEGPSPNKPFHFLGFKFFVTESAADARIIKRRHSVYLEYSGLTRSRTGEILGYHIMQSVALPQFPDLSSHNSVCAMTSMRFIYRQKGDGLVEVFMLGSIDVSGWLIKPMATMVIEDVMFGMTRMLDCSETKRLTQMACEFQKRKHDERPNKQIFVTSNDGLLGKLVKVPVCSKCIMTANISYYEQQYRAQQKSSSGEEMAFQPMHLSDRYDHFSSRLLSHTVRAYEHFAYDRLGEVDTKFWKTQATRDELAIYKERHAAITPATMMLTGVRHGFVENAVSTLVTKSQEELALVIRYLHGASSDCGILHTMEPPTEDDPFHFLGFKYYVSQAVGDPRICKRRHCVYLEDSGFTRTRTGEKLGYHIMHSVHLPQFPDLRSRNSIPALMSTRFLYRQREEGIVEVFMLGNIDIKGLVVKPISLRYA